MKDSLSSLELHYLVRELQALVGARFDKAYQGMGDRKRDVTLQFQKKDEGRKLLHVMLPGFLCAVEEKPSYDVTPGPFAVFLRKHVGNARVIGLRQRSFDRILEFVLENKDGQFFLILELLPPGNALLLNKDGKVINLLEPQRHGQRVLRGGVVYEPPPVMFDTKTANVNEVAERLFATTKDSIVKAVASDLGLGGEYAEEACARAGIDKLRKDLTKVEVATVAQAVKDLFELDLAPVVVDGCAYPFTLELKAGGTTFDSFSAALATLAPETVAVVSKEQPKRQKLKSGDVVKQQEAAHRALLTAADENQRKAELIYEHYQEVSQLLAAITEARKKRTWQQVKEEFKDRAVIDEEKGTVTIDLPETST